MVYDTGRLCLKTAGRESGKYCVIVSPVDKDFVLVTGPKPLTGVRRRKCNVEHLEPVPELLKLKKDASDKEVLDALKKAKLYEKLGLKELTDEDLVKWEEAQKAKELKKVDKKKAEKPVAKPKAPEKKEPKPEAKKEESAEPKVEAKSEVAEKKKDPVLEGREKLDEMVKEKAKAKKSKPKAEKK